MTAKIKENEDLCLLRPNMTSDEPFYFAPVLRAKLKEVGEKQSYPSYCFKKNVVTFKERTDTDIVLTLESSGIRDIFCLDFMVFHTSRLNQIIFKGLIGNQEIVLKNYTQDDLDEIKINGIKVFSVCNDIITEASSLVNTVKVFLGGLGTDPNDPIEILRPSVPE